MKADIIAYGGAERGHVGPGMDGVELIYNAF